MLTRNQAKQYVHLTAHRMAKHLANKYPELESAVDKFEDVIVRVRFKRIRNSWGGQRNCVPYISIGIPTLNENATLIYTEYKHVESDPEIGRLNNASWQVYVSSLVAHEMAHAADHILRILHQFKKIDALPFDDIDNNVVVEKYNPVSRTSKKVRITGHGKVWQEIYRDLRINFANDISKTLPIPCEHQKRKYNRKTTAIGVVKIRCGSYRGHFVNGEFYLVKPFKTHAGRRYSYGEGFVTILSKNKTLRINVYKDNVEYAENFKP